MLQSDGQQQRTIAQLACNLTHSLLQGQVDGSDGPDAAYKSDFVLQLAASVNGLYSLLLMCKNGRLEIRHGALAVVQLFLKPKAWHDFATALKWHLASAGAIPTLFDIATDPRSAIEMRSMATTCLEQFRGDVQANTRQACFGAHPVAALLIGWSLQDTRELRNQDH